MKDMDYHMVSIILTIYLKTNNININNDYCIL